MSRSAVCCLIHENSSSFFFLRPILKVAGEGAPPRCVIGCDNSKVFVWSVNQPLHSQMLKQIWFISLLDDGTFKVSSWEGGHARCWHQTRYEKPQEAAKMFWRAVWWWRKLEQATCGWSNQNSISHFSFYHFIKSRVLVAKATYTWIHSSF